ncbi:MAG: exonuclease SbcCD subunit D [Spirochaetales bacterium]|nr:exonuclease SbcCD subunit D [Spirochaetales bacterium]
MKFAHISDLHLGKTLHSFSLIDDQEYILNQIVEKLVENKVDVLLVAGDIYDKNVAPETGIKLFRKFLNDLVKANIKVMVISGNHDSAERLTFGGEFMTDKGLFFSKVYDGKIEPVVLQDENGPVNIYLLPFIKPSIVQHYLPDEKIESYEDAVSCAIRQMNLNLSERNLIVAHQNILSAERCESEENIIGGLDAVSDQVFKDFDYVALGHIHKQQEVGKSKVMFSGTPLKYSTSELEHDKVMPLITLGKKGEKEIELIPLVPKRDLRQIKGTFDEIMRKSKDDPNNAEDYIDVILTDENDILDAISTLRTVYPNILKITYDNKATKAAENVERFDAVDEKKPLDVFEAFYKARRGADMDESQREYIQSLIEKIWGEN